LDPNDNGDLPATEPVEHDAEPTNLDGFLDSALDGYGDDPKEDSGAGDEPASDAKAGDEPAEASAPGDEPNAAVEPAESQPLEPPARWTDQDKATFANLPREAQNVLLERHKSMEADYTRKAQEIAEYRKSADPYVEAINPYQDYLSQIAPTLNSTPDQLIGQLLAAEYSLRTGSPEQKAQALAQIAASYGIAPTMDGYADGNNAYQPDPFVSQLYQNQPVFDQRLAQLERITAEQQEAYLENHVNEFATAKDTAGNLVHPYFEDVKVHMRALLQIGEANSLGEAYEIATAPIGKVAAARSAARIESERQEKAKAVAKARQAAPVHANGSAPKGQAKSSDLDSLINQSLTNAGWG
jgi:hypothetical protein